MDLNEIRLKIDEIDNALLPLFLERMACAKQVATIKKEKGLPILNTERENEILEHVAEQAGDYAGEARLLYTHIMELSRGLQHNLLQDGSKLRGLLESATPLPGGSFTVACLGDPGSFTRAAAGELFPQGVQLPFHTFSEVFSAVAQGNADFGVVAVENSSAGSVSEVYDNILKYRFFIVGAETFRIHQCLAAPVVPTAQRPLTAVYSHPQALSQCSEVISQLGLEPIPCSSTTEGAFAAKEYGAGAAAICSLQAATDAGLTVLRENVQNAENNRTRFIIISRSLYISSKAEKISLCFSLPHRTGSLYSILARFAAAGLNLTKIESRPIAGRDFEYDFYLDFSGSIHEERVAQLLCALSAELPRFSFLGNYCEKE